MTPTTTTRLTQLMERTADRLLEPGLEHRSHATTAAARRLHTQALQPGVQVALRTPVLGATFGRVVHAGDCGYPKCGAGEDCIAVQIETDGGVHTVNRVAAELELVL